MDYKALIDHIQAAVVVHDRGTRIIAFNRMARELLGLTEDQLMGRDARDPRWRFLDADGGELAPDDYPVNRVIREGRVLSDRVYRIVRPGRGDEDVVTVMLHADPILDDTGNVSDVVVTFMDITAREQMERAQRESEAKYRGLFHHSNDAIFIHDTAGCMMDVNQRAESLFGYTRAEMLSLRVPQLHPPSALEKSKWAFEAILAQGQVRFETEFVTRGGEVFPAEVSASLFNIGEMAVIQGIVRDIRERRLADQARREAYDIIENSPVCAFLWRNAPGWPVAYVTANVRAIFGYTAEDFLEGRVMFNQVVHAEDLERVGQEVTDGSRDPQQTAFVHAPYRIVSKSGQVRWVRDHTVIRRDAAGAITHYQGIVEDITAYKQRDNELRQLRNYLAAIIDAMPSVLIGVDPDGIVTQWNLEAQRVSGLAHDRAQGQPLAAVFPRLAKEMDRIGEALVTGQVVQDSRRAWWEAGEPHYEDVTIYPLLGDAPKGAVIRVDDVTERVRIEEMMIQNEKMLSLGGLAAGMAHEINNPLAGILQNANVLHTRLIGEMPANQAAATAAGIDIKALHDYLKRRKLPEAIDNIRSSGQRAADIVTNMLRFARKSDRDVATHDIRDLLDQTLQLARTDYDLKRSYDFKHIRIDRRYDAPHSLVPCKASKLQQVFLNLLANGAEAMAAAGDRRQPPAFVLRVRNVDDWLQVEIEDNGPGVKAEMRRQIFEPFFTTKPVGEGTGLGLSVSYFIITTDHRGEMWVEPGHSGGARFVLRLPVGCVSDDGESAAPAAAPETTA